MASVVGGVVDTATHVIRAALGVLVAMVGLDSISGAGRSTVGATEPTGGVDLIPLLVHGLRPGPQLFESDPELLHGAFIAILAGLVFLLVVGGVGIRAWAPVIRSPPVLLWPVVLVLSIIGACAVRTDPFDVFVMLPAGVRAASR